MFTLEFSTDDLHLIALATAYWSRAEGRNWDYKLSEVESTFSKGRGKVLPAVAAVCIARLDSHQCTDCAQGIPMRSRADADFALKKSRWRRRATESGPICAACRDLRVARDMERRRAAVRASHELIAAHRAAFIDGPPERDYEAMTLREAFLLAGMLRYAGDAWRAPALSAWSTGLPPLCDTEADTRAVFDELYACGWMTPSPDSPSEAFSVSAGGVLEIDVLRVGWVFAADAGGRPASSLLGVAQSIEASASGAELHAIWQWVCLSELRAQFAHCQREEKWPGHWSDALQRNLLELLEVCPLGPAKTILWKCIRFLTADLHARKRPVPHTYNMLPGNLLRTFDLYQSRGWNITSWRPLSSALYSQHLFNHVMGGGPELYDIGTGSVLRSQSQGAQDEDEKQ